MSAFSGRCSIRGGREGRAVEQALRARARPPAMAQRRMCLRIGLIIAIGLLGAWFVAFMSRKDLWCVAACGLNKLAALLVLASRLMQLPLIPPGMRARAWPPVLATRGPGGPCAWHSHHSLRFALALEGEVRVRTARHGKWSSAPGVLTAPDVAHLLDACGGELLLVFLDPESVTGAPFHAALRGPVRLISDSERRAMTRDVLPRAILRSGAADWAKQAAAALRLPAPVSPRLVHPRVRTLLSLLRNGGVDHATSLEGLAIAVGLSPGRLMHVFTSSVGIPLRPYLAWLRVQRAAMAIVSGNSIVRRGAHSRFFGCGAHEPYFPTHVGHSAIAAEGDALQHLTPPDRGRSARLRVPLPVFAGIVSDENRPCAPDRPAQRSPIRERTKFVTDQKPERVQRRPRRARSARPTLKGEGRT